MDKPLYFAPLCETVEGCNGKCFECPAGEKILEWDEEGRAVREELGIDDG